MYCLAWAPACIAATAKPMPSKPFIHHFMRLPPRVATRARRRTHPFAFNEELASRRALSIPACDGPRACEPVNGSMRERPQPQLFLRDLPDPRQTVGLDDQEEDDQAAEHHQLEVRRDAACYIQVQCVVEKVDDDR